jgi:hypothetical protein
MVPRISLKKQNKSNFSYIYIKNNKYMKKILLTESEKKAIILEKEKSIIANFAKTFNTIKRIDENELNESNIEAYVQNIKKKVGNNKSEEEVERLLNRALSDYEKIILSDAGIIKINSIPSKKQNKISTGPMFEDEVEEGALKNLAVGALATAGSLMGGDAKAQDQTTQPSQEMSQIYNEPIDSVIEKGGSELGMVLIDLYYKNPELAKKWEMNNKNNQSIQLINMIKNAKSSDYIGNIYGGEDSNLGAFSKDFITFMKSGGYEKTASL